MHTLGDVRTHDLQAAAISGAADPAAQAQGCPTKPVFIGQPFGHGGNADQSVRNLAQVAQSVPKQPVMIVNRAGANATAPRTC